MGFEIMLRATDKCPTLDRLHSYMLEAVQNPIANMCVKEGLDIQYDRPVYKNLIIKNDPYYCGMSRWVSFFEVPS